VPSWAGNARLKLLEANSQLCLFLKDVFVEKNTGVIMARRKRESDASVEEFLTKLRERVARGEDLESALDAIDEAETRARNAIGEAEIRARNSAFRTTLRQYEDSLRSHGFVRRASETARITYSHETSPEDEVALIFISDAKIEWSYSSPKTGIPVFGKDPSSLEKTLSFHYKRQVIQLGPSSLGSE